MPFYNPFYPWGNVPIQRPQYKYDGKTGEYLGIVESHESPRQPGFFTVPKNTTTIKPPDAAENEAVVWVSGSWILMEDHRGRSGFVDKKPVYITELGPLPEGWSDEAPAVAPGEGGDTIDLSSYATLGDLQEVLNKLSGEGALFYSKTEITELFDALPLDKCPLGFEIPEE